MAPTLPSPPAPGLERSCAPAGDWFRAAPPAPGIERGEAAFAGHGFDPHRHDTYAVGVTLAGVQAFRYRGAARISLPGDVFVLHPDETHDGRAGTPGGFRYRTLYVEPRRIGEALGGAGPLPFVREPVARHPRIAAAVAAALADLDAPLEPLRQDQIVLELADALAAAAGGGAPRSVCRVDARAVTRAREFLDAAGPRAVSSRELGTVSGLSRYALARQFRAALGTSPHRYLLLRRLDRARQRMAAGDPLAEVALACGFADQSHFTRHFRKAYGVAPGQWARLGKAAPVEGLAGPMPPAMR